MRNGLIMKTFSTLNILIVLFAFLLSCDDTHEDLYLPMELNSVVTDASDYGLSDGSIDIRIVNGEGPFTYLWSNGITSEDVSGLTEGEYSVKVTDNRSNTLTDTILVNEPNAIILTVEFVVELPDCEGAENGSITTTIAGGYEPFSFVWSSGEQTPDLLNLAAGLYILTIEDSRGQSRTDSITLSDYVLTDVDGNEYSTIKIGDQVWMKQNLRVTHAPDSSEIVSYIYNNDVELEETYGRLYSWNVAMNSSDEEGAQGICPCGWHLPSDEEYKLLEIELGMTRSEADMTNTWRGTNIGTALITGGSSDFEARLSGRASSPTRFSLMGRMEYYWTSSEYGNNAWRRCLDKQANNVGRWNTFPKSYGFSIRCVKD